MCHFSRSSLSFWVTKRRSLLLRRLKRLLNIAPIFVPFWSNLGCHNLTPGWPLHTTRVAFEATLPEIAESGKPVVILTYSFHYPRFTVVIMVIFKIKPYVCFQSALSLFGSILISESCPGEFFKHNPFPVFGRIPGSTRLWGFYFPPLVFPSFFFPFFLKFSFLSEIGSTSWFRLAY